MVYNRNIFKEILKLTNISLNLLNIIKYWFFEYKRDFEIFINSMKEILK
jgi:hypothetical protein